MTKSSVQSPGQSPVEHLYDAVEDGDGLLLPLCDGDNEHDGDPHLLHKERLGAGASSPYISTFLSTTALPLPSSDSKSDTAKLGHPV